MPARLTPPTSLCCFLFRGNCASSLLREYNPTLVLSVAGRQISLSDNFSPFGIIGCLNRLMSSNPPPSSSSWVVTSKRCFVEPLVDHILLAEFDIDTGSTVRHQYPQPVEGYKNDWFAELMLPEGAHNRERDWTYIFLNRDQPQLDEVTACLFH